MADGNRIYKQLKSDQLQAIAKDNWSSLPVLNAIVEELQHRKTWKAHSLRESVTSRLVDLARVGPTIVLDFSTVPSDFQSIGRQRGIVGLTHFTSVNNLPSILERGLWPRELLEKHGVQFEYADYRRFDGKEHCCFSIGQPNRKMFYRIREERAGRRWVFLLLHALPILGDPDTTFTPVNAASREAVVGLGIDGLLALYAGDRKRKPPRFPSNQQAEVMVAKVIDPSLIYTICCENETDWQAVSDLLNGSTNVHRTKPWCRCKPKTICQHVDCLIRIAPEYFAVDASYSQFTLS